MISRLVRLRAWGSEDNEIVILVVIRVGLKPRLHNLHFSIMFSNLCYFMKLSVTIFKNFVILNLCIDNNIIRVYYVSLCVPSVKNLKYNILIGVASARLIRLKPTYIF